MGTSLELYISFLRDARFMGGLPMLIGGLGLMLFGWRMWKICVVISFGLIGFGVTHLFMPASPERLWYAVGGGLVLAAASYFPAKHSVSLLGGLIAAGVIHLYLQSLNMDDGIVWAGTGIALIGGTAYAAISRRHLVIGVTAFLGAILFVSGAAALLIAFPGLFNSVRYLAERSAIVIPFVLMVPTVMSCFYQVAEVHRLQAEV